MKSLHRSSGFALLLVLWTLVILSAIGLTLAVSVGTEIRSSQSAWDDLQIDRLAKGGHEVATYLESRAFGTTLEDLSGLPVQPVVPGLTYRVAFEIGTVDITLDGENRKLDPGSAPEDFNAAFFTTWTGDPSRGREIAASIGDWIDTDNDPRALGAERPSYVVRSYSPRNGVLGNADLFLIKGLEPRDLPAAIIDSNNLPAVREPLMRFISAIPSGARVNPSYASRRVLESVPGMGRPLLQTILDARRTSVFADAQDFQKRTGLTNPSSTLTPPILDYFVFDRGPNPAVIAAARLNNSNTAVHVERRVRRRTAIARYLALIEHGFPAE